MIPFLITTCFEEMRERAIKTALEGVITRQSIEWLDDPKRAKKARACLEYLNVSLEDWPDHFKLLRNGTVVSEVTKWPHKKKGVPK